MGYSKNHDNLNGLGEIVKIMHINIKSQKKAASFLTLLFPASISYILFKALFNSFGPSPKLSEESHESLWYRHVLAIFVTHTSQLIVYSAPPAW